MSQPGQAAKGLRPIVTLLWNRNIKPPWRHPRTVAPGPLGRHRPQHGQGFRQHQGREEPAGERRRRLVRRRTGLPGQEPDPGPAQARWSPRRKGVAGVQNVSVNITTKVVAHAVQRGVAAAAQRQEHHRRRLRQGRRGQEHHGRQPGAGAGRRGRRRRPAGCRHLRPQPADDDGHRRPARERRTARPWSRWRTTACRSCRSASWSTRTRP